MPVAFIPHGGGPWPILKLPFMQNERERQSLYHYMEGISQIPISTPSVIIVISAHWEEPEFTINQGINPPMLFDYYGFPPEAYKYSWPAPGSPALASQIQNLLSENNIESASNDVRGFDHGVFIPLMLAFPRANIPVVQISLKHNLDPVAHFRLGRTLAPLRKNGAFIIGSGNSYHNLNYFFRPNAEAISHAQIFDNWLCESILLPSAQRGKRLMDWLEGPSAREIHPREEHFIPLIVCAGAAGEDLGHVTWQGSTNGLAHSAFHFG